MRKYHGLVLGVSGSGRGFHPWDKLKPCPKCDKMLAEKGHSLRDAEIKLSMSGQSDILLSNPQAMAEYPELSFLLDGFNDLYEQHKGNKAVRKVFERFEKALEQAEAAFSDAAFSNAIDSKMEYPKDKRLYGLDDKELFCQPIAAVVEEWFYGRLDGRFYYNDVNNDRLQGFLVHKLQESKHKEKPSEMEM